MWNRHARAALAALLLLAARASLAASPAAGDAVSPAARPFFEKYLPEVALETGPLGLLWWQWLALPVLLALAMVAGALLGFATRAVLTRLATRTKTSWDDMVIARVAAPLTALWAMAFLTVFLPWLDLGRSAEAVLQRVLRAGIYLALFWAGFRLVGVAFAAAVTAPWTRTNAALASLLPLGRKIAKIVLLALGAVAILNELGFQVASLLAGLGIGGIALALAAQKTVENLFGSVSIGVDQPFRIGDAVKVEDFVGTVESIGMRSTRFRTMDRTIITIPNGKLADSRTETFAARDRIRLYANLAIAYGTSAAQLRRILAEIEAELRRQPLLSQEAAPSVRFTELKEWSLNVEVVAFFQTTDWGAFAGIRQDLLLRFMEIVQEAGTSFAFPVREVRLAGAEPRRPEGKGNADATAGNASAGAGG